MNVERLLRGLAGFFVLASAALARWHSPWWLLFTAFVGLNLLQSAFTGWCLMMTILRWAGLPPCCPSQGKRPEGPEGTSAP